MKFLEHVHIIHAAPAAVIAANEDMWDGGFESDVISLKNAESAVWIVIENTGTGAASIQIFACDDTTPANTAAISFHYKTITAPDTHGVTTEAVVLQTGAAEDTIHVIEVNAAKVAEQGYKYVQLSCTEASNFPVNGAVVALLTGLRSAEDVLGTQVT